MSTDTSLPSVLEDLSAVLLGARLRAPNSTAMFPGGHAAFALAHAELEQALPGRGHAEQVAKGMARAVDALGKNAVGPILYGGFTGLAWVAQYLDRHAEPDPEETEEDSASEIDTALLDFLTARDWEQTYDLIGGLVGYGLYALERLPRPSAVRLLEAIVGHLKASAESVPPGISWRTDPDWLPPDIREDMGKRLNLGLAHGVPGIIGLLGRIWRAGVARSDVEPLLEGAVAWLLAQERPASSLSAFGNAVGGPHDAFPARSAWCYGDPGIVAALLIAARATGERAWERAAIRVGARAAARDPKTCGVVDAGICHGSGGLAHVYHRLHVETGDERFLRAARLWLRHTLAMREPGKGLGGYRTWNPGVGGAEPTRTTDFTFLTGTPGIAMALAGFASKKKTKDWASWDRVLLLSDVPAPAPAKEKPKAKKPKKAATAKPKAKRRAKG